MIKTIITILLMINVSYAYEIIIDKTLKVKEESKYTYPALIRDDSKQTVYDPSSNLTWQDNNDAKSIKKDWEGAKKYCNNLNFAGYSNWKLPTIKELETIADFNRYPNANKKGFKNFIYAIHWSSSPFLSNSIGAWFVYFKWGLSSFGYKTSKYYVRCARQGQ